MAKAFDIVVIGGGPGGYVAAIRASQLGLKVAVIERENMGGVCLNWGCIPTKALLRSAEIMHLASKSADFGIKIENISFDIEAVVGRSREVAGRLSGGVSHLMKKNGVTVIEAVAKLGKKTDKGREVLLDKSDSVLGKSVILATGARARALAGIEPDGESIITYREAMIPAVMPSRLIIVGSGAIGIEFASFYNDMGVEVTVLEAAPRILPAEDAEISALAEKSFTDRGIIIRKGVSLEGVKSLKGKNGVEATISPGKEESKGESKGESKKESKKEKLTADKIILAVGIVANTENLGLEDTAIELDKGHVITDSTMRTGEADVYAIGDMTGAPWLAHKASHEGIIAAEHIAAKDTGGHGLKRDNIPGCTYCRPQIASVGLSEEAASKAGYDVKIGRFPLLANGKAIALGDDEGLIKTIFDAKTGALLGAHMIGAEVTELIQGFVIAKTLETTEEELMQTVFAHPTLSEAMHESVLDAYGKALHF